VSSYLQAELQRPDWEHKTGKEGLEAALSMLRAQLGPLVTGADGTGYAEVLLRAKALARAGEDLEGLTERRRQRPAGQPTRQPSHDMRKPTPHGRLILSSRSLAPSKGTALLVPFWDTRRPRPQ
jgi:hypothetical protein